MKKSILSLCICSLVVAVLLTACHPTSNNNKVALGPMPSRKLMPDPLARQLAGEMRTWVEGLKPSDAEKLNGTGKILFSWAQLEASYPKQARIIDDYQEQRRIGFVDATKKLGKPIPERLAVRHTPDTVEIEKLGNGEVRVVISSKAGIEHNYLEIAAAR